MYIAVTNFVIPALFSLVQLIIVYQKVNPVAINDIIFVNTSIAVIGVAFATVWAGTGYRGEKMSTQGTACGMGNTPAKPEFSTMIFQSNMIQSSHGTIERSDVWTDTVEEGRESVFHNVSK